MYLKNKHLFQNYEVIDTIEAGIMLYGLEVKSIRDGCVNFSDSFVQINEKNVPVIVNLHIHEYFKSNRELYNSGVLSPKRERTLLLHKKEIFKLKQKIQEKGLTLIPSAIYFKDNKVKVEISLCRGLKKYNKKDKLIQKDLKKLAEREIKCQR